VCCRDVEGRPIAAWQNVNPISLHGEPGVGGWSVDVAGDVRHPPMEYLRSDSIRDPVHRGPQAEAPPRQQLLEEGSGPTDRVRPLEDTEEVVPKAQPLGGHRPRPDPSGSHDPDDERPPEARPNVRSQEGNGLRHRATAQRHPLHPHARQEAPGASALLVQVP